MNVGLALHMRFEEKTRISPELYYNIYCIIMELFVVQPTILTSKRTLCLIRRQNKLIVCVQRQTDREAGSLSLNCASREDGVNALRIFLTVVDVAPPWFSR